MRIIEGDNKFTIQNFDKWIDRATLKKGEQYFANGAVLEVEENNGNWTAGVEGTEMYTVNVSLIKDGEIDEYVCDCPHDADICKHIAAAFFAILQEIKERVKTPLKSKNKKPFDELLSKITAEEYRSFIKEYSARHKDFKTSFELFFADKDDRIDVAEKYTDLLRKLVKKYSGAGYVDYRSSSQLANEVDRLIGKSNELAMQKNYRDAFTIALVILKEMLEVLSYSDDSNGSLGGVAYTATEAIVSIAEGEDVPVDMKEHIFGVLNREFLSTDYFGYGDFGYDLFSAFEDLAAMLNKEETFVECIDKMLKRLTGRYDNYQRDFLNNRKISFYESQGKMDKVEDLVQQNLDIVSVRQGEVEKAIAGKKFAKAKQLIADGIKIAETNKHPGTVSRWEEQLLQIAILENDLQLTRFYYKKFALDSHWINKEYYNKWRATYKNEAWTGIINKVIEEKTYHVKSNHKKNAWSSLNAELLHAVAPFYIEEKYWEKLFDLVKYETRLDTVLKYHKYLMPFYPDELLKIYLPALEEQGGNASDRSAYANLAKLMNDLIKDIPSGKAQIIEVAQRLMVKKPRRPAMIEELKKVTR